MMRQLGAQGALDQRLLEPPHRRLDVLGREQPVVDELVQDLGRAPASAPGRHCARLRRAIGSSSCYKPRHRISDTLQTGAATDERQSRLRCLTMPDYTGGPPVTGFIDSDQGQWVGGHTHISERDRGRRRDRGPPGKVTLGDGGDVVLKDKIQSLLQQRQKRSCSTSAT